MDYSVISIAISVFSLTVAGLSLGWNIYRDVVLKPRLLVRLSISHVVSPGMPGKETTILISATNFGPGPIYCNMIVVKDAPLWRWLLRKVQHAIVIPKYQDPLSGQLPTQLAVGATLNLLLPYVKKSFLAEAVTHVGLSDSFSRTHWASQKDVRKTKETYRKDFKDSGGKTGGSQAVPPS